MRNLAININQIINLNTKRVVEAKFINELESFIEKQTKILESDKKQLLYWVLRFMKFHNHQHPSDLMKTDIDSFLSSLATENHYNQKLQKSAEFALLFLYQSFMKIPLKPLNYISVQQRKGYLSYFGENKCMQVVEKLSGKNRLMLELMLLGNLKLSEVINLQVSDVDIKSNRIKVYSNHTKGSHANARNRDLLFTIIIPIKLVLDLRIQKLRIKQLFGHSKVKKSGSSVNGNNESLLFQTNETLFGRSLEVDKIKQSFKLEVKQAIKSLKNKRKNKTHSVSEKRFNQLRSEIGCHKEPRKLSRLNMKKEVNQNYQFELEVA